MFCFLQSGILQRDYVKLLQNNLSSDKENLQKMLPWI